jgi:hypothetical protein
MSVEASRGGRGRFGRKIGLSFRRLATNDNLDLYCLAAAAFAFTVLGALQIVDISVISSVIMAALAFLAVSQIRSRNQVMQLTKRAESEPLSLLRTEFPDELAERVRTASDFLFIGRSGGRVSINEQHTLRAILKAGGTLRMAVLNPTDASLMRVADRDKHGAFRSIETRIRQAIENLEGLRDVENGDLQLRVLDSIPHMNVYGIDMARGTGFICVQLYEFAPQSEPAPIMQFKPIDAGWYRRFNEEAERLWASAKPWPLC